jgi:NADH-quinone oxidoreductase subunit H
MIYAVYLILFGLVLTGALGLTASWVDRKVTARVQYRVGPPFLQPLLDILKLTGKETLVPSGTSRVAFLAAPVIGLAGVVLVSTILWVNNFFPQQSFLGDWIVVLYLLLIPPLAIIVGGFASRNPLASLGASREMQIMLAYELPFLLAAIVPVIKADYAIRLGEIIQFQRAGSVFALSASGILALLVGIICVQAKLSLVPFDIAEAETELSGGVLIEYSGTSLAMIRLSRNMLLFSLPFLLITFFLGGIEVSTTGLLVGAAEYIVLLLLISVIRNTNPRVRVDQALRFFWGPVLIVALVAVLLALTGY